MKKKTTTKYRTPVRFLTIECLGCTWVRVSEISYRIVLGFMNDRLLNNDFGIKSVSKKLLTTW